MALVIFTLAVVNMLFLPSLSCAEEIVLGSEASQTEVNSTVRESEQTVYSLGLKTPSASSGNGDGTEDNTGAPDGSSSIDDALTLGDSATGDNTENTSEEEAAESGTIVKTQTESTPEESEQEDEEVYNITYHLDGGVNDDANPFVYTTVTPTITLADPVKTGYTFVAWYSDESCTEKKSAIELGSTGDLDVYAKWKVNQYNVKFYGNGNTSGKMNALEGCDYGTSYKLPVNSFARNGYTFVGWNTSADGSGEEYADNQSVKDLSAKNGETIRLYAQWLAVKYKITYKLGGGTNSSKNPTAYTVETMDIQLTNPKKPGYKFAGWYDDAKYKNKVTVISKGSTGNKTLYAKWVIVTYRISYKLNGGKLAGNNPTSYTVNSNTITVKKPTKNGYTFAGWYADPKYKKKVVRIEKGSTGNKVLYAKWTVKKYTITYKLNGGKNNKKNPSTYSIVSQKITLAKPTRLGYTFKGWYKDAKFKTRVTDINKGSKGNKTFYAKWSANTYKVKFNGNGASSGSMKALAKLTYGKTYALTRNSYTRNGYSFVGWNTKPNGTGTYYSNGARVKNLTGSNNGTVTLYAQWRSHVSYVSYSSPYGSVALVTNNYSSNVEVTATFLYYNGSTLVETSKDYVYCLERGHTCALRGWIHDTEYTSYKVSVSWEEASSSKIGNASFISVDTSVGDEKVIAEVTNNGNEAEFTQVAIVFYKNNNVVGYDYHYADVSSPGSIDYIEFDYPHTTDYKTIYPDSYSIYVNESYRYDWS
jgi:uncharacterized repeat protein (TIGR02543 family)